MDELKYDKSNNLHKNTILFQFFSDTLKIKSKNTAVEGVDISQWNGTIDWDSLKESGVEFVLIKATQGIDFVDPMFAENWQGAREAGLLRGAYHFYQPGQDAKQQATFFLQTVNPEKGDLIPALDFEEADSLLSIQEQSQAVRTWLQTVEKQVGQAPMIYTDYYFWNEHTQGDFSQYPLWIADWETTGQPLIPRGWTNWTFWQYSDTGNMSGISSAVDQDRFAGNKPIWTGSA